MNARVELIAADVRQGPLLARAERLFHEVDARFSRFSPESELWQLNLCGGRSFAAGPEMIELMRHAQAMQARTRGLFEPAILGDLEDAGYDRAFANVARDGPAPAWRGRPQRSVSELEVDPLGGLIAMPVGARIDFGGIIKGYAMDRAAAVIRQARNFLITAGSDILARGDGPDGDGWCVGIGDPHDASRNIDAVMLRDEALGTSSVLARRWMRGGRAMHHIIDPRTRMPAETDVVAASVVAPTAVDADVFAKCAVIIGSADALSMLSMLRIEGLLVLDDGRVLTSSEWPGHATRSRVDAFAA